MSFRGILTAAVVGAGAVAVSAVGMAAATSASTPVAPPETQATLVASQFMQALNTKRFGRTCALLSERFYGENHVASRESCARALRAGFSGAPRVRFSIRKVTVGDGYAVVRGLIHGASGKIVLIEENDVFRVLSVSGPGREAESRPSGP
jgi:hypothetical protein